tara:strand:- start:1059 stop:1781 length:723 start_codon:yes stop_codon:yes gene_type:complete
MSTLTKLLEADTPKYTTVLPISNKKITYRPFRVKEEKILLMAMEEGTEEAMLRALISIIDNCCEGIGDAGNLISAEVEHIFLNLRAKSVGEVVEPTITCPHTGEPIQEKINLNEVTLEVKDNVPNKIKISDNLGLTLKLPSVNTIIENEFDSISDLGVEDSIKIVALCIEEIWTGDEIIKGENTSTEEKVEFLENLSPDTFEEIISFYENAPKLIYNLKYKTKDGTEREITLSGLQDFFA